MNNKKPRQIDPADAAKGAAAEQRFQDWLDSSEVAQVYVDQTTLTMPKHLRGEFKRVDNFVGIPDTGIIAFDVKAKTAYQGKGFIFDLDEVQKLRIFARQFHLTVFFACLDPEGSSLSYWVRLDQLAFEPAVKRVGKLTVACALDRALEVDMAWSFYDAYFSAIRRK